LDSAALPMLLFPRSKKFLATSGVGFILILSFIQILASFNSDWRTKPLFHAPHDAATATTTAAAAVADSVKFHMIVTKPNFSVLNLRAIESIFHFHPSAHLCIHTNVNAGFLRENSQLPKPIMRLQRQGYHIETRTYAVLDIVNEIVALKSSTGDDVAINVEAAQSWLARLYQHEKGRHWYSHETDFVRLFLIYVYGGIYMDTDVILVRPLVTTDNGGLSVDSLVAKDHFAEKINCAVLKFLQPRNSFIAHSLNEYFMTYNGSDWDYNGPQLLYRVIQAHPELECPEVGNYSSVYPLAADTNGTAAASCAVNCLSPLSFQPVPWHQWKDYCFAKGSDKIEVGRDLLDNALVHAVHLNNQLTGARIKKRKYMPNSICDLVLKRHRIFRPFWLFWQG
jgi:Glycosyltransferase sugar-binding region containing DXD motif/Alpha 1,4-glycosyltransferase conserved region